MSFAATGGVHGASMPHRLQRIDAGHDLVAAPLAIKRHDQTHTAGVQLLRRIVAIGTGELGNAAPVVADELPGIEGTYGHDIDSREEV